MYLSIHIFLKASSWSRLLLNTSRPGSQVWEEEEGREREAARKGRSISAEQQTRDDIPTQDEREGGNDGGQRGSDGRAVWTIKYP